MADGGTGTGLFSGRGVAGLATAGPEGGSDRATEQASEMDRKNDTIMARCVHGACSSSLACQEDGAIRGPCATPFWVVDVGHTTRVPVELLRERRDTTLLY